MAQFTLTAYIEIARVVNEAEVPRQWHGQHYTQLFPRSAGDCDGQFLAPPGVGTAAIGPVARPQWFELAALLQQNLPLSIE